MTDLETTLPSWKGIATGMAAFTPEEHKLFQEALEKYGDGASGTEWASIVAHCRKTELEVRRRARARASRSGVLVRPLTRARRAPRRSRTTRNGISSRCSTRATPSGRPRSISR